MGCPNYCNDDDDAPVLHCCKTGPRKPAVVRWRFKRNGGHTLVRVFVCEEGQETAALAGTLIFRNDEFDSIRSNTAKHAFLNDDATVIEPDAPPQSAPVASEGN